MGSMFIGLPARPASTYLPVLSSVRTTSFGSSCIHPNHKDGILKLRRVAVSRLSAAPKRWLLRLGRSANTHRIALVGTLDGSKTFGTSGISHPNK